jgi:hypothetical protein
MKRLGFLASRAVCASAAVLVGACDFGTLDSLNTESNVEASTDVTAKAIALWTAFGTDDDAVRSATANFEAVLAQAGNLPVQVKIGRLTKADLASIGMESQDPAAAQGMLVITQLDCSLDDVQKLLVAKNQPALFPGAFDTYERTYQTDVNAFLSGGSRKMEWSTTYSASALGATYESTILGSARRVPGAASDGGPVLIGRLYQNAPARITKGSNTAYEQEYQVALYYPRGPKSVVHFYAKWQQLHVQGLTSDSEFYIASSLGNLIDFEVRTSKLCRDGNPQPTF